MLKRLHDFLKGEKTKEIVNKRDYGHTVYYTYYIKVESGVENHILIYKTDSTNENIIGLFSQMEFVGLYIKDKDVFYNSSFELDREERIPELKIECFGALKDEVTNKVRNNVVMNIGYDVRNIKGFTLSDEDMERIKNRISEEGYDHFMSGKMVDKYNYASSYSLPEMKYSGEIYLNYLKNPDSFIEAEVNEYIKNNALAIGKSITLNKLIEKKIEEISKDKDMVIKRKIYSILNDKSKKTLNVELTNGIDNLSCKIQTVSWNYIIGKIVSYNIVGVLNRDKFEEMFAENRGDAHFDNIVKITYGKNVLYEKNSQ